MISCILKKKLLAFQYTDKYRGCCYQHQRELMAVLEKGVHYMLTEDAGKRDVHLLC